MNHRLTLLAFVVTILAGCGRTSATPTITFQPSTTTELTFTPTNTIAPTVPHTATEIPAPTATLSPTETPLPTATSEPTATPTPDLPISLGETLPQPLLPITAGNAHAIGELARYGAARVYGAFLSTDRARLFSLTSEGIKVYQAATMERLAWFDGFEPLMSGWGTPLWGFSASADGNRVSLLTVKNQVQVYDIQEGLIYSQTLPVSQYFWATLSADGLHLAVP